MKKYIILILIISSISECFSQTSNSTNKKAIGDTLWSEDFGNGMPPNWTIYDSTGLNMDWRWANQDSIISGTGFTNHNRIQSSTGANGFMLLFADSFNPDLMNPVDLNAYFQTDQITLPIEQSYILEFQQDYRLCCNPSPSNGLYVVVSSDPTFPLGINTESFVANDGVWNESWGLNSRQIDISSIAVGAPQIFLRFYWRLQSYYYWEIDDIAIVSGGSVNIKSPTNDTEIMFYPNPTKGIVTIDLGEVKQDVEATLTNSLGQIIVTENYSSTNFINIDIDTPKGIYFLQLEVDGELITKKIIKE
jgi:hypothetical protein